jgi:hypothetical protein
MVNSHECTANLRYCHVPVLASSQQKHALEGMTPARLDRTLDSLLGVNVGTCCQQLTYRRQFRTMLFTALFLSSHFA